VFIMSTSSSNTNLVTYHVEIFAYTDNSATLQFSPSNRGRSSLGFDIRGRGGDSVEVTVSVHQSRIPVAGRVETHTMHLGKTRESGVTAWQIQNVVMAVPTTGIFTPNSSTTSTAYVFAKSAAKKLSEQGLLDGGRYC
jgi:hypothetical protein